jgi:predicted dienelactone hydrolase
MIGSRPVRSCVCALILLACGASFSCGRLPRARRGNVQPAEVNRPAPPNISAGFRKLSFTYQADGERSRSLLLWYPTATEASRFDYNGQIGLAAPAAPVLEQCQPLILFSHGFLGAADQTIFLMEELARAGYLVAAVNHADAVSGQKGQPVAWPNFAAADTWGESKYRDRKEDLSALLDHLLSLNKKEGSFLHQRMDEQAIGAIGHSLGGYAVLGLAGARKSWRDDRVGAALLLSPYALPYLNKDHLDNVKTPVMLQGGTLDWGITPFLPGVYKKLHSPKYYLVLKNESHFGWTNLISLGKTTTECVKSGNAQLMRDYSIAFFDCHMRRRKDVGLLQRKNPRLESYQYEVE